MDLLLYKLFFERLDQFHGNGVATKIYFYLCDIT